MSYFVQRSKLEIQPNFSFGKNTRYIYYFLQVTPVDHRLILLDRTTTSHPNLGCNLIAGFLSDIYRDPLNYDFMDLNWYFRLNFYPQFKNYCPLNFYPDNQDQDYYQCLNLQDQDQLYYFFISYLNDYFYLDCLYLFYWDVHLKNCQNYFRQFRKNLKMDHWL